MKRFGIFLVVLSALAAVSGAAAQATTPTSQIDLGIAQAYNVLVDDQDSFVFASDGSDHVVAESFSGGAQYHFTLQGADGLALDPATDTVYVTDDSGAVLHTIDGDTMQVGSDISLDQSVGCARNLTIAGATLWFTYDDCSGANWGLGSYNLDTQTNAAYPEPEILDDQQLVADPADPSILYTGDEDFGPPNVFRWDASGGAPVETASQQLGGSAVRGLAVSPDGSEVYAAAGSTYLRTLNASDLSVQPTQYQTGSEAPIATAVSSDGRFVFASIFGATPDIYVFSHGSGAPIGDWTPLGYSDRVQYLGVSADTSKLFLISNDATTTYFSIVQNPTVAPTAITVSTPPAQISPGAQFTLTGTLTIGSEAAPAGSQVSVARSLNGQPTSLSTVTTDASGHYSDLLTAPATPGEYVYTFTFAGDATHATSSATTSLDDVLTTTLSLKASSTVAGYDGKVTLTAHLTGAPTGTLVSLNETLGSSTKTVATAHTSSAGIVTFTRTVTEAVTMTAIYGGDATHLRSSAQVKLTGRASLTPAMSKNYYAHTGGYYLYHRNAGCTKTGTTGCPVFSVTVKPFVNNRLITFQSQELISGSWRNMPNLAVRQTAATSGVRFYIPSGGTGYPTRTRAVFSGDTFNAAVTTAWLYWHVTK